MKDADNDNVISVSFKSDQTVEVKTARGKMLRPMDSEAVRERHDRIKKLKDSNRISYALYGDEDDADWPPLA